LHVWDGRFLDEVLECLLVSHHVVEQDEDLVAEAFIFELVPLLHDVLEELLQRRDDVLDSEELDRGDANRFDGVPDDLEAALDYVRAKIHALEDHVDDILQDAEVGELLSKLTVQDARGDEFQDG
jgi:hypothetical protein